MLSETPTTTEVNVRHGILFPEGGLELRFKPGFNVLVGPNGAGKTMAVEAATAAHGGECSERFRDAGREQSWVIQAGGKPGVLLEIGARTTRSGSPQVRLADADALSALIAPPGKTKETRQKRRLEIFQQMAGIQITDEILLELTGGDHDLAASVEGALGRGGGDLAAAAAETKKVLQAQARSQETQRDEAAGVVKERLARLASLRDELNGVERPAQGLEELGELYTKAAEAKGRLDQQREVRVAREDERARAGELGPRPNVEAIKDEYRAADQKLKGVDEQIQELQRRKAVLEERRKAITRRGEEARLAVVEWEERKARFDEPIVGPTEQDVRDAANRVEGLAVLVETAEMFAERDKLEAELAESDKKRQEAEELAKGYRESATKVYGRVNQILSRRDFGELAVNDEGELCAVLDGGVLAEFEELSEGQRVRVVLSSLGCLEPGRVLPLDRAHWTALDSNALREVVGMALEHGVMLVSELPLDAYDGIETCHLGDEWVASDSTPEEWIKEQLKERHG